MSLDGYRNKIICGNCLEVLPRIPDGSIDLVLTDPPYETRFEYIWTPLGKHSKRVLRSGGHFLTLCGHHQLPKVIQWLSESGLSYWWCCAIWNHQEPFIFKNRLKVTWKPLLWFTNGTPREYDSLMDGIKPTGMDKAWHPWGQSESFAETYIAALTLKGEIVLDPLAGSGTVPVVAKRLDRDFIGIEIDPDYCRIAEKRLAALPNTKLEAFAS